MTQRKPYNPNTAYGRKKLREQAQEYYENLPPDEKDDFDMTKILFLIVIVVVVVGTFILLGNGKGAVKWLSH